MACTAAKLKTWLTSEKHTNDSKKVGVKDSTEAQITTTQEQTQNKTNKGQCLDAVCATKHITAVSKMFTGKAYIEYYNQVIGIVHYNICTKYVLEVQGSR